MKDQGIFQMCMYYYQLIVESVYIKEVNVKAPPPLFFTKATSFMFNWVPLTATRLVGLIFHIQINTQTVEWLTYMIYY